MNKPQHSSCSLSLKEVARSLDNRLKYMNDEKQFSCEGENVDDKLSEEVARIIVELELIMSISNELIIEYNQNQKDDLLKLTTKRPEAPPYLLSLVHLCAIYSALELLWVVAMKKFVFERASLIFDDDNCVPKSIIFCQSRLKMIHFKGKKLLASRDILRITMLVWTVCRQNTFTNMMLERNLKRILATLLCLGLKVNNVTVHEDTFDTLKFETVQDSSEGDVTAESRCHLESVIDRFKHDKSHIIKINLLFSKGTTWLRTAGGRLTTRLLLEEDGLKSLMLAFLDGVTDGAESQELQQKVAMYVTSVPKTHDSSLFLTSICCQLVPVIRYAVMNEDKTLLRVCALISERLAIVSCSITETAVFRVLAEVALLQI